MIQARLKLGAKPLQTLTIATILYAFSIILIDIAPFFVGLYVDHLGLTLSQAGFVQTLDQAGGVAGAILGFFLMPRVRWKKLIVGASILATLANGLTAIADSYLLLCLVRFVSGFGVVLITTVTACILARAANPDRVFGVGLALGMILSAAAIWLLDAVRIDHGNALSLGSGSIWLGLGLALSLFLTNSVGGSGDLEQAIEHNDAGDGLQAIGRGALVALLLFGISVNVVYVFIERVGLANGLDQAAVANALALGYVFSAFGSLIPTIFGAAGGRLKWIGLTTILFIGSLLTLYAAKSAVLYTAAFAVYASAWNMGLAYYMAMTAENDPEQRYTRMMYIVNVAAQSVGPAIGALVLTGAPLASVFVIAPVPAFMAALLAIIVSNRFVKPARAWR